MKKQFKLIIISAALLILCLNISSVQSQELFYKRLGGYDAIAAVSDEFVSRLASEPQLKKFTAGLSTDSQKKIKTAFCGFYLQCNGKSVPLSRKRYDYCAHGFTYY